MSKAKLVIFLGVSFLATLGITALHSNNASAARTNTAEVCFAEVRVAGSGSLSGGRRYVTMEYRLKGNDNARRFKLPNGSVPSEPGWFVNSANNCPTPGGGALWNGSRVDFGSQAYKSLFGNLVGRTNVDDIYFGLPSGSTYNFGDENYTSNPNIGWYDASQGANAKRGTLGIVPTGPNQGISQATQNSIFASLNDAGYIKLNNQRVWCVGMDFPFVDGSGCRGGDAATVYNYGGDFAGYQAANNSNALANVSGTYRGYVQQKLSIKNLLGINQSKQYFDLSMAAQNTRDAVSPALWDACFNSKPGTPNCYPGFGDPLTNNKTAAVFTFVFNDNPNLDGAIQTANCSVIRGWAADKRDYNHQTSLRVYVDGREGQSNSQYFELTPDFDGGQPESGEYKVVPHQGMPGSGGVPSDPWHGFEIPQNVLAEYADAYPRDFFVEVIGTDGAREEIGEATIGPCAPPECRNSAVINPSPPQANQPFTAGVGLTYSPGAKGRALRWRITLNIVRTETGQSIAGSPQDSQPDAFAGPNRPPGTPDDSFHEFSGLTQATTGSYTARWLIRWNNQYSLTQPVANGQQDQLCTDNYNVGDRPYLRVYGNDVAAGSGFATEDAPCLRDNRAAIEAWQKGGLGTRAGASGQLAVFALGTIDGFFSANLRNNSSPPRPHNGLTFGNFSGVGTISGWGGLSGLPFCATDYFGQAAANGITPLSGLQTINEPSIPDGEQQAIYVDGNVYITAGPDGKGVAYQNTSWSSPSAIPSFYLIVRGNIYINPNVTRLDGVYIAQPTVIPGSGGAPDTLNPNTGKIVTCSSALGVTPPGIAACNKTLTINGTFIARQVLFQRTLGTLTAALPSETAADTDNVAEVFKFSPELYLAPLHSSLSKGQPNKQYDYITSLPPIL